MATPVATGAGGVAPGSGPVAAKPPAGAAGTDPERAARRRCVVLGVVGVLGFLLVAELVTRAGIVNERFLPPVSAWITEAAGLFGDAGFRGDVGATVTAWGVGLATTIAIAVPVGLLLGSSDLVYRVTRAVIELVRPIPPVALIPLAILLLGVGLQMKLGLVVYAALWPILFNTIYGVHDVDPVAKETARSFGFSRGAIVRRVVLPSAAPFVFAGVRIASAIALMMVVSAELIGGVDTGVGAYMARVNASGGEPVLVYAATLVAGVIGFTINLALAGVERRLFAWRPQDREA